MAECKYPNEVCANMTMLGGVAYCDGIPCELKNELPKQTNADRIRTMRDEELAEFIVNDCLELSDMICGSCTQETTENCGSGCCVEHIVSWLQKEVKE